MAYKEGRVRIISGQWKKHYLRVVDHPQLRPTGDRVRETLFNWLGQDLSRFSSCCDMFAGSGALGLEAASRGAKEVYLFEKDPMIACVLHANLAQLPVVATQNQNIHIICADSLIYTAQWQKKFNLIFLDPPFSQASWLHILNAAKRLLDKNAWLYLETDKTQTLSSEWHVYRYLRTKKTHCYLLQKISE